MTLMNTLMLIELCIRTHSPTHIFFKPNVFNFTSILYLLSCPINFYLGVIGFTSKLICNDEDVISQTGGVCGRVFILLYLCVTGRSVIYFGNQSHLVISY